MAYSGSLPAKPSRAARGTLNVAPPARFTHEDASLDTDVASVTSGKYPAAVRMAILVGGSAMLWGAIGHIVGIV